MSSKSEPRAATEMIGGDISTELAARRTGMSFQRTRMSADRTLMSVIRTSLSLIGFGFTIYQVFHKAFQAGMLKSGDAPLNFGIALVLLGITMLAVGIVYHLRFMLALGARARDGRLDFRSSISPRFQGDALEHNLELVETLREVADGLGASPAQVAIAWVLARGEDVVPLLGARRRDRLDEALGALDVTLGDARSPGWRTPSRPAWRRGAATPPRRWGCSTPSASGRRGRSRAGGRASP